LSLLEGLRQTLANAVSSGPWIVETSSPRLKAAAPFPAPLASAGPSELVGVAERFFSVHMARTTSPGFKRSWTHTSLWESMVTASTLAVAAPITRRLTAPTASTLFLTATWYRLTPVGSVTATVQPNACALMHGRCQRSHRSSTSG